MTDTTSTATTYGGQVGSSYQFRARARDRLGNLSAWSTGPLASVVAPPPPTPTGTPPPGPDTPLKVTSRLRIAKARLSSGKLTTSGRLTSRARGRVTVIFSARAAGRTRMTRVATPVSDGVWSTALRLTGPLRGVRAGKLTVSYRGDSLHTPSKTSKTVRRSRS